MKVAKC